MSDYTRQRADPGDFRISCPLFLCMEIWRCFWLNIAQGVLGASAFLVGIVRFGAIAKLCCKNLKKKRLTKEDEIITMFK